MTVSCPEKKALGHVAEARAFRGKGARVTADKNPAARPSGRGAQAFSLEGQMRARFCQTSKQPWGSLVFT